MVLVRIAGANDLEDGQSRIVPVDGRNIALFKISGRFYAVANECPHQRGPLGEGGLDGTVVSCPWHGWKFDVASGKSTVMENLKIGTYSVVEKDGGIFIEI